MRVAVTVNGTGYERDVEPRTLLAYFLREHCGLTGTHVGCDTSSCGCCVVVLDGDRAVKSCTMFAAQADGHEITTVEGLGGPESLSPIQQAFVHHYAAQCGFCTSGMMLAAQAYLDHGGTDDHEAIQEALGGHVCRCTGYSKIVDAVAAAARGDSFDLTTTAIGKYTTMAQHSSNGGAE